MNPLPGNPHTNIASRRLAETPIPIADDVQINFGFDALTQAILALAHEQRTLTLVNVARMYADLGMAEHAIGIIDAITNRLGGHDHE